MGEAIALQVADAIAVEERRVRSAWQTLRDRLGQMKGAIVSLGNVERSQSTTPALQLIQVSLTKKRSENGKIDGCGCQRRL
jgi:hypothetical protein